MALRDKIWEAVIWAAAIVVALIGASGLIKHYSGVLNPNDNPAIEERLNAQQGQIDIQAQEIRDLDEKLDALGGIVALNTRAYGAMVESNKDVVRQFNQMHKELLVRDQKIVEAIVDAIHREKDKTPR